MSTTAAPPGPGRHPLVDRLFAEFGYAELQAEAFDVFAARPGHTLLFFVADPQRVRETLDLAVIVPELAAAFPGRFAVGVLLPAVANPIALRYGVRRWPALVMLRDGRYVGAIEGVRDWDDYGRLVAQLLATEPTAPPAIVLTPRPAPRDDDH
ncbi:MAG TPA: hydrogenase [Burkholderiales bacterium]|nr:hydrogenase [Burkholderiales bacterium]